MQEPKPKDPALRWFARCEGIARMGPFADQLEASDAIKGLDGNPRLGAFVWPERTGTWTLRGKPKRR